MANILGRHPSRWPVSPESGFMGFSEEIVEPSIPCHSNVDIGVLGNIFPPESLFEENIIPPLPALEATETPPKSAIVTGGEAPVRTTAINFSRPLVGRPSHHVALGLVDRPPSGDFAQFVASFPLPLITDPRNDSSQLESPQDIPTEEDLPFRNNIQPHQTSLVERFLSIHNLSSSLDVDSQSDTPKIKDRFIKRKRVPQQTISPKAQSFSACPDPRHMRLSKGSLEGLIRYRKLEKGELTPLPEIKRLSGLLESFEKFGLLDTQNIVSPEDNDAAASDAVSSDSQGQQPADDESSEIVKGKQPLRGRDDNAAVASKEELSTIGRDTSHPNPLHSNAVPIPELSYARYLSNGSRSPLLPPRNPRRLRGRCRRSEEEEEEEEEEEATAVAKHPRPKSRPSPIPIGDFLASNPDIRVQEHVTSPRPSALTASLAAGAA